MGKIYGIPVQRIQVPASSEAEALKILQGALTPAGIRLLVNNGEYETPPTIIEDLMIFKIKEGEFEPDGFLEEDGKFVPYASPPDGYTVHRVVSQYYGSHSEYGEGDEAYYFALPDGTSLPRANLSHGHYGTNSKEFYAGLPQGSLVWSSQKWKEAE
jgi:hypothetical protein